MTYQVTGTVNDAPIVWSFEKMDGADGAMGTWATSRPRGWCLTQISASPT